MRSGPDGKRIILDHVSASWSIDETLSVGDICDRERDGVQDVTVQWSIIAESLNRSLHTKGPHGYGSLIKRLQRRAHPTESRSGGTGFPGRGVRPA